MLRKLLPIAAAVGVSLLPPSLTQALRPPLDLGRPQALHMLPGQDTLLTRVERALAAPQPSWEPAPGYWDAIRDQLVHARRSPGLRNAVELYQFPVKDGERIGSGFGPRWHPILKTRRVHQGWDLPRPRGTPVFASGSGRVEFSGWRAGYGQVVRVRHVDGRSTLYGHLGVRYVRTGEWARAGQTLLGRVGTSGLSTGPHLHFELRDREDRPVDPSALVRRAFNSSR